MNGKGETFCMAIDSAQELPDSRQWSSSDEIDLTRYAGALWSRKLEISLITAAVILLTGATVWAYRALTPPHYEAVSTAVIVRTSTDVRFDERFTTTSEPENVDSNSRRMALIALVNSGDIAQQVINELGDNLPARLQDPAALLEVVKGGMATVDGRSGQSDLINIVVNADSAETAATIANVWAAAYVQQVNNVYGQVPDDMLRSVELQLAAAQQTYEGAQAQLESHLADSPRDALVRESKSMSETLLVLLETQMDLLTSTNDRSRSQLWMLQDQWLRTNRLLIAARTLQDQLSSDQAGDVAGAALALQVLNVQIVDAAAVAPPAWHDAGLTFQPQQPTTLQLQFGPVAVTNAAELRTQIAATVAGLETQLAYLEQNIDLTTRSLTEGSLTEGSLTEDSFATSSEASSAALVAGLTGNTLAQTITGIDEQLRVLTSQIEVENARTLEFTRQRDLAWQSLQALNNKQAELLLARAAANSEVRISSTAVPLNRPIEQVSLLLSLLIAAIGGLLLAVLAALALEIMQVRPLRSPRSAA